jgi:voltage-gated potassium channel
MYFIVEGEIEIRIKPHPVRLGPGSFFGEIALITGGPRTATAVATRKSMLLALDIVDFREIAARHPELMRAINEEARRRVGQSQTASGRGA